MYALGVAVSDMLLQSIRISNFKRILETEVPLSPITVLVGGNNSGKSCVLQAAHLAIGLMQSESDLGQDTFTPDKIRYQPSQDFWECSHGERLVEGGRAIAVTFNFVDDDERPFDFEVKASRGPGEAIVMDVSDREHTARTLSDVERPYSIYVPGLAGIPLNEEFRVDASVVRGIARGDANLYLRNILLRISSDEEKKSKFDSLLGELLPESALEINFDPRLHQTIDARIKVGGVSRSIETLGTGSLQYIQILAYVVQFEPALLLLDEPDAHLHPNNQRMIAAALQTIASEGRTKIILATHSRTVLDAFQQAEEASFVWIENGEVQLENQKDKLGMLMTLGALDGAERFYSTDCTGVILTEDTDTEYLETLLLANGAVEGQLLIHSYRTSSQINAATLLASFINTVKPGVRVIIHRDRDFMQDAEVVRMKERFKHDGHRYDVFVTKFSDVEHYFVQPSHIASSTGLSISVSSDMVRGIIERYSVGLYDKFRSKRDEIKSTLYNDDRNACPSALDLMPDEKMDFNFALGKTLIKKVANELQVEHKIKKSDLLKVSVDLKDETLSALLSSMPKKIEVSQDWPSELKKDEVSA